MKDNVRQEIITHLTDDFILKYDVELSDGSAFVLVYPSSKYYNGKHNVGKDYLFYSDYCLYDFTADVFAQILCGGYRYEKIDSYQSIAILLMNSARMHVRNYDVYVEEYISDINNEGDSIPEIWVKRKGKSVKLGVAGYIRFIMEEYLGRNAV